MEKIKSFCKRWEVIVLFIIIAGAFFVRTYNFHDWLFFKMDQARDSGLIGDAIENGPEYLPLLGARAGATKVSRGFLRLGPAFYYFQYVSGKIAGSTKPDVFAYPDLFFSMLAIPLVYLLSRLYFSKKHSLVVTTLYAFSFIIIQYSRFAWNPNSLQFFTLLTLYGLLRFLNEENSKKRKWWLAAWALGLSIGSQLHFLGFFILVGISGLMILFHYEMWRGSNILGFFKLETLKKFMIESIIVIVVFLVPYTPQIISETMKNYQNSKNFIEAIFTKPADQPLLDKLVKNVTESAKYYSLITMSYPYKDHLKDSYSAVLFTAMVFLGGLYVLYKRLRENLSRQKKDFLILLIIWIGVFFALSVPVSFQLRPRFYILVFAVPFIFIALIWEYLEEKYGRKGLMVGATVAVISFVSNAYGTYAWFGEQADSQLGNVPVERTLILKAKDGITLGQLEKVADWMYARKKTNANFYYYVKPEYNVPIKYLLREKNDPKMEVTALKNNDDPNGQFFAVTPTGNGIEPFTKKFGEDVNVLDSQTFGQLEVFEVEFPNRRISGDFRFNRDKGNTDRKFWKDVFGIEGEVNVDGGE